MLHLLLWSGHRLQSKGMQIKNVHCWRVLEWRLSDTTRGNNLGGREFKDSVSELLTVTDTDTDPSLLFYKYLVLY